MDNAVSLVQAYLRVNGYFTVTELPVIEAMRGGGYRTATDIDVLAFRFRRAGRLVPRHGASRSRDRANHDVDPELGIDGESADMLIGEVKEGKAELNRGAREPAVIRAALTRFGCCSPERAESIAQELVRRGHAETDHGHRVRLVAFGSTTGAGAAPNYHIIRFARVVSFLESHLSHNWDTLRQAEFKEPGLAFLGLLHKAGVHLRTPKS